MARHADLVEPADVVPDAPFGWALFFLRGVAPPEMRDIYLGVMPFIGMQVLTVMLVLMFPQIALWLPKVIGW